jgi:hypothetical protein
MWLWGGKPQTTRDCTSRRGVQVLPVSSVLGRTSATGSGPDSHSCHLAELALLAAVGNAETKNRHRSLLAAAGDADADDVADAELATTAARAVDGMSMIDLINQ